VLAFCVAMVITQTSRALYFALARILGVEHPDGERGDIAGLLIGPAATILVFGVAWIITRRSLVIDAENEAPRQASVRRLYAHLVAFVALAALATGLGGLLWTLVDALGSQAAPIDPNGPRD